MITFRYVLSDDLDKVDWYIQHDWLIVGEYTLSGWHNWVFRKG